MLGWVGFECFTICSAELPWIGLGYVSLRYLSLVWVGFGSFMLCCVGLSCWRKFCCALYYVVLGLNVLRYVRLG
jgi:hypothetical protein